MFVSGGCNRHSVPILHGVFTVAVVCVCIFNLEWYWSGIASDCSCTGLVPNRYNELLT